MRGGVREEGGGAAGLWLLGSSETPPPPTNLAPPTPRFLEAIKSQMLYEMGEKEV